LLSILFLAPRLCAVSCAHSFLLDCALFIADLRTWHNAFSPSRRAPPLLQRKHIDSAAGTYSNGAAFLVAPFSGRVAVSVFLDACCACLYHAYTIAPYPTRLYRRCRSRLLYFALHGCLPPPPLLLCTCTCSHHSACLCHPAPSCLPACHSACCLSEEVGGWRMDGQTHFLSFAVLCYLCIPSCLFLCLCLFYLLCCGLS